MSEPSGALSPPARLLRQGRHAHRAQSWLVSALAQRESRPAGALSGRRLAQPGPPARTPRLSPATDWSVRWRSIIPGPPAQSGRRTGSALAQAGPAHALSDLSPDSSVRACRRPCSGRAGPARRRAHSDRHPRSVRARRLAPSGPARALSHGPGSPAPSLRARCNSALAPSQSGPARSLWLTVTRTPAVRRGVILRSCGHARGGRASLSTVTLAHYESV
jgi:hypothetical protein